MFCNNCGTPIPDGATACPNCHAALAAGFSLKKGGFQAPTQGGKKFIAICTALTLIPAIFIFTIDFAIDLQFDWNKTGYVIGALLVLFVCTVLPSIHITPAPVTTGICFLTVSAYVMYVLKQINGNMEWFTELGLPLILIFCVFLGLDSVLTADGKLQGAGRGALYCAEGTGFFIAWSVLYSNYKEVLLAPDRVFLRLLILFTGFFLTMTVIFAAAWYISRVHKQK